MWLILQQDEPDDFVTATGSTRSVREFAETAFDLVGLDWNQYVEADDAAEVHDLRGDASKARAKLGWSPGTSFEELVREMLESDPVLEGVDLAQHLQSPQLGRR